MTGKSSIRRAGFYESAADVLAVATTSESSWEKDASRYLEQGEVVIAASQWVGDLLDADIGSICQFAIQTDGVWVWPSSLTYYVRKYHVDLPAEFLSRMESKGWTVGELESATVDEIGDRLVSE
ncbi:hypothetical protein [Streptomyces sp. NPDC048442]|uniref:hypothetical protein n=1 Tax=Streptomyces sp. NPDC048442 TaxID=3154823 RepID=UPI003440195E